MICVGRNYVLHAKELGNAIPEEPVLFLKPSTALNREREFYIPAFTQQMEYEAEIVLKIVKNGKFIDPAFAWKYVSEITVGIDFTARDVQSQLKSKGLPWEIAKAFDNSASLGQWVPLDTVIDRDAIPFQLFLNDNLVQDGNTKDMLFSVPTLISYISKYFTLQTGDYIFTGTPAGVGQVKIGDRLQGFIAGVKLLECHIS